MLGFCFLARASASLKLAEGVMIEDFEPVVGNMGKGGDFDFLGRGYPIANEQFNRGLRLKGMDPDRCKCFPCSVPSRAVETARNERQRFEIERANLSAVLAEQRRTIANLRHILGM